MNIVHNTDCLPAMKEMDDNQFDLAIVDPPYGIKESAHRGASRTKLAKTKLHRKEFWDDDIPSQEYFDQLFRVSKDQIIWGINYFVGERVLRSGSGRVVWDKVNTKNDFSDCELAFSSFHHSTRIFRFMWNGMCQGKSVGEGHIMQGNKKLNEKRIHPTQKPVALYEWLLDRYGKSGMKILDTHVGSGSIRIACHKMGFDFEGYELDKKFFTDQHNRFLHHTQQQSAFTPEQMYQ